MTLSTTQTLPNRVNSSGNAATIGSTTGSDANDPTRLNHDGTHYAHFHGTANNNLTVPDAAALDLTDDLELVFRIAPTDWTPTADYTLLSKGGAAYEVTLDTTGVLRLTINSTDYDSTVATGLTDGTPYWIKITRDRSSGDIDFYQAADAATEPAGGSYTAIGTTVAGTTDAIATNATNLYLGSDEGGLLPFNGSLYRAIIRSTIGGASEILDVNPAVDIDTTSDPDDGQTSFTATTGQTVTVNRATSGLVTTIVTRPVIVTDGTNDYIQLPTEDLPAFTATTGTYTALICYRSHLTQSNKFLWSSQSGASNGAQMFINAATTFFARVYGTTTNAFSSTVITDNSSELTVVGLVVDNATINNYVYGTGLGTSASTSGVGTITHQNPRIATRGDFVGACFTGEIFHSLTFQDVALTETQLDTIAAKLIAGTYT